MPFPRSCFVSIVSLNLCSLVTRTPGTESAMDSIDTLYPFEAKGLSTTLMYSVRIIGLLLNNGLMIYW